ncbi:MAG: hypothetical protein N3E46_12085 [Gemmataceae bacterium]|nr:hypothetical protein [Gemmataceae bacterium]
MTSRRLLLLVLSLVVFGLAYGSYAHFFGWLDGLPVLPERYLIPAQGEFRYPEQPVTPTLELLKQAFGEHSPEVESLGYPTRLAFRRGDTTLLVACGRPPAQPDSHRVTVAPFSAAVFGKPKPPHQLQPGETVEIATFHADKAVLEFDRIIRTPTDMNEARLVRLELISDPEAAVSRSDPRVGIVHMTHNQRSLDPNRWLILRTPGPVFYRDNRVSPNMPVLGPDIWTDAPVEIVDRANLPRRDGGPVTYASTPAAEIRQPSVVAAILAGERLPPPTVTAVGLRVYLQPRSPETGGKPKTPPSVSSRPGPFSGLRRVELLEQVRLHLWMEAGGASLLGMQRTPAVPVEKIPAVLASAGGLVAGHQHLIQHHRELLQVETRGPFLYDVEKNTARFEVLPQVAPHLPNDVQVTRIAPAAGIQSLFTQVLELELEGGKPAASPPAAGTAVANVPPRTAPASAPPSTHRLRRLHAWTYTPGRILTVSSEADQLHATGTDLVHDAQQQRTTLTGTPLIAVQQRHVLTAGTPQKPAELIWEPDPGSARDSGTPPTPAAPRPFVSERRHRLTVRGAGRIEMHDPEREGTVSASWQESLTYQADPTADVPSDVITLTGSARYEDPGADYRLQANLLRLWVKRSRHAMTDPARRGPSPDRPEASGTQSTPALPTRIQALGNVSAHSAELIIEQTDHLNVLIRDASPPDETSRGPRNQVVQGPPPPGQTASSRPAGPPQPPAGDRGKAGDASAASAPRTPGRAEETPAQSPRKPPLKLRARTIDTWLARTPERLPASGTKGPSPLVAPPAASPPQKTSANPPLGAASEKITYKYTLERARCEGMVSVHQDPADPSKVRGTDIRGSLLLIDHTPEGSILTLHGWDNRPGELHHEGTSLIGPWIKIDQVHNLAVIEGRGSMAVPATTDLAGNTLSKTEPIVIHFRDGMTFKGALRTAEFFGRVSVAQGDSGLTCHTMRVIFDRPVYFATLRSPSERSESSPAPRQPNGTSPRPAAPDASSSSLPGPPQASSSQRTAAEDNPRIEAVHCYPSPADTAEHFRETLVYFHQVERDAATGRLLRQQQLEAQELTLLAQARDTEQSAPYRFLEAHGPGVVRIWGPGVSEVAPSGAPAGSPSAPAVEMQLTIVQFSRRMIAKDKGRNYKEATFYDNVQVVHVPTENPHLEIKRPELPPRAVLLTCQNKLVVWTYRRGEEPPRQHMHAYGNAYLQSEEYAGSAEVIKNEGKLVILEGSGAAPATIRKRFRGDEQTAQRIIYDRATQQFTVEGSLGGAILAPSSPASKGTAPRPLPPRLPPRP